MIKGIRVAGSGACAILAYIRGDEMYIANTGDCRAVLGRKLDYSKDQQQVNYTAIELSQDQTATSPSEFSRLCEEHPGEESTVVVRGRILGGLQPSRAFGMCKIRRFFILR